MKFLEGNELLFRFMLINIFSGIATGMMNLIIPVYALSLNATSAEIGFINGISGIGDLLLVLPAGYLIDHFGSRRIFSISCIFGALIFMLLSFATDPVHLLFPMVLYGMARTLRSTSLNAAFLTKIRSFGIKKIGWYNSSMTIGIFIGPVIGGIALLTFSFSIYFVLSGLLLLVPLVVIFANKNGRTESSIKPENFGIIDASNHYKSLVKNRTLVSAAIIAGLNSAFFITFTTFTTVLVVRDLILSPEIAAMLISIRSGTTILAMIFCGEILRRNNNTMYLFSFVITIISLLIFGISTDLSLLIIASGIQGFGSGLISLINMTQIGNIDGEKGKIASVFFFGIGTGAILGPTLGGIIGEAFGVHVIFLAFILPFGALAFYTFKGYKKQD